MMVVFGETPRISRELLSDDRVGLMGANDSLQDPFGADDAAKAFRKSFEIRQRANMQRAMEQFSKEAIRAVKASTHQSRHWAPGQWVYVCRKGRPNQELHPRDRWVGPGVVLLSNNSIVRCHACPTLALQNSSGQRCQSRSFPSHLLSIEDRRSPFQKNSQLFVV